MTKICTRCKQEFPIEDFAPRKDRNNRPHSWCNECRLKNVRAVSKTRAAKIQAVQEYKASKGCKFCGFDIPIALDLHHRDPSEKEDHVSHMFSYHAPLDKIFEEVSKCDVVCANCHRLLHAGLLP